MYLRDKLVSLKNIRLVVAMFMRIQKQYFNDITPQAVQKNINIKDSKDSGNPSSTPRHSVSHCCGDRSLASAGRAATRELITRFDQKIRAILARIWDEEEPTAAEV